LFLQIFKCGELLFEAVVAYIQATPATQVARAMQSNISLPDVVICDQSGWNYPLMRAENISSTTISILSLQIQSTNTYRLQPQLNPLIIGNLTAVDVEVRSLMTRKNMSSYDEFMSYFRVPIETLLLDISNADRTIPANLTPPLIYETTPQIPHYMYTVCYKIGARNAPPQTWPGMTAGVDMLLMSLRSNSPQTNDSTEAPYSRGFALEFGLPYTVSAQDFIKVSF